MTDCCMGGRLIGPFEAGWISDRASSVSIQLSGSPSLQRLAIPIATPILARMKRPATPVSTQLDRQAPRIPSSPRLVQNSHSNQCP